MVDWSELKTFRWFLIFISLIVIAAFIKNPQLAILIAVVAYVQNSSYSIESRGGTRNSYLYYALGSLISGVAFYTTMRLLLSQEMSLWFFGPYVVATVLGSVTGSQLSSKIEKRFNITTRPREKGDITQRTSRKFLLLFFILIIFAVILGGGDTKTQILLICLASLKNMSFSLVRRSRNTSKPWYHAISASIDGFLWYLVFRELVLGNLSYELLPPYMLGNIIGGMSGQKVSMRIESYIGATADGHLEDEHPSIFVPVITILFLGVALTFWFGNFAGPSLMFAFASAQSISFSLVSRSRNRNNIAYHAIASIFSNGIWYLVFRHITQADMQPSYAPAYVSGSVFGSLIGVGASMKIEKILGAVSDEHVLKKT